MRKVKIKTKTKAKSRKTAGKDQEKPKKKRRQTRQKARKGTLIGAAGLPMDYTVDAVAIKPHWVEVVEMKLPLPNLPDAFFDKRIVQISDLHCSRAVKKDYLLRCVERINQLDPDMVVLTGDYITYEGKNGYKQQVVDVVGRLQSRQGVYACLGNHDYGFMTRFHQKGRTELREFLTEGMAERGITVLQNESQAITLENQRLWMVGLGDLWSKDFAPAAAFAKVTQNEPVITLAHNPDTLDLLQDYPTDAVLCGHTHGGQINIPLLGPPYLPIKNRQFCAGMFHVYGKSLYVNRGLGRLGRVRFNCRPEITVFTLVRQPAMAG